MATNFNSFNSFYPMNKIFKYILGIIPLIVGISFCNATIITGTNSSMTTTRTRQLKQVDSGELVCVIKASNSSVIQDSLDGENVNQNLSGSTRYCYDEDIYFKTTATSATLNYHTIDISNLTGNCPTCPTCETCQTCEDQYTSLECQTEYNLIPIENVTANYCHVNFGLIDPASCPISEGTGEINWSSLYINNTQYASNDSINLGIPDFIAWNLTYNTGETIVEIEGYNADTEYMDSIIAQTEITPTAEDMSKLVNGLQAYLPYFFIGLICVFFIGLVKKFFRG